MFKTAKKAFVRLVEVKRNLRDLNGIFNKYCWNIQFILRKYLIDLKGEVTLQCLRM